MNQNTKVLQERGLKKLRNKFPGCDCNSCPSLHLAMVEPSQDNDILFITKKPMSYDMQKFIYHCYKNIVATDKTVGFDSLVLCDIVAKENKVRNACAGHLTMNKGTLYVLADIEALRVYTGINTKVREAEKLYAGKFVAENMYYLGNINSLWWNYENWYIFQKRLHRIFRPDDFKNQHYYENAVKRLTPQEEVAIVPKDIDTLFLMLDAIPNGSHVAYDVETENLNLYDRISDESFEWAARLLEIIVTYKEKSSIVIPGEMCYIPEVKDKLEEFFTKCNHKLIAHNSKFDYQALRKQLGIKVRTTYDTMLMHGALFENSKLGDDSDSSTTGIPKVHGLKIITEDFLGLEYESVLVDPHFVGVKKSERNYADIPEHDRHLYGAIDGCVTFELFFIMKELLIKQGLWENPFLHPLMSSNQTLCELEYEGIPVDVDLLKVLKRKFFLIERNLTRLFRKRINKPNFNPLSSKQLGEYFYDELGWPEVMKLNKNRDLVRTTGKDFIAQYLHKHPEILKHLVAIKRVRKMRTTYVERMLKSVDTDGRIHLSFKVLGAATGRPSVVNPAFQTLPKDTTGNDFAAFIRACLLAEEGWVFVIADYSQAEIRVAADASVLPDEDGNSLTDLINSDADIHDETCKFVYEIDHEHEAWKNLRRVSKIVNFRVQYGADPYSAPQLFNFNRELMTKFAERHKVMFAPNYTWRDGQFQQWKDNLEITTILNRRRRIPFVPRNKEGELYRKAANHFIQGSVADFMLESGTLINEAGRHLCLSVHDEHITLVKEKDALATKKDMEDIMIESAGRYFKHVKWKVDADITKRYGELPDIEVLDKYLVDDPDYESFKVGI